MKYSTASSPTAAGEQLVEVLHEVVRQRGARVVDDEWRFVEHELGDARARGGGFEREHGARRVAEHVRGAARLLDERLEVIDLAFDRVGRRVAAVAAPAAVVRRDGEVRAEEVSVGRGAAAITQRAPYDD
jgi:hypothetical protein